MCVRKLNCLNFERCIIWWYPIRVSFFCRLILSNSYVNSEADLFLRVQEKWQRKELIEINPLCMKRIDICLQIFRSKSDHNSGSQSSLPKDAKKRREGVLELSNSTRFERARKEGMQEGFSMPQSHKKRKEGVQEGVSQTDLMDSSNGLMYKAMDG